MKRNLYLGLLLLAVVVAGAIVGWRLAGQGAREKSARAKLLYQNNCAVCHGRNGDGKGEAAYLLQPKPRNFRAGKFRLVSSQNLQPIREDLFRTITNGMPGTPMPSWAHLSEADRQAVADYVLSLNRCGWCDRVILLGYSKAEAEKYDAEMAEPGLSIPIPPEPPLTQVGLQQGREYYLKASAKCH
jgi:mono/diheme cytochrome c family protein